MSSSYLLVLVLVFVVGSYVGRWLYRGVHQFPKPYSLMQQLRAVWRESDCRSCPARESGLQHLPIISWWLDGRCHHCQRRMDMRRPLVELLTAVLLTWLYWVEIPYYADAVVESSGLWTGGRPPGPEAVTDLWSLMVWLHLRYLLHAVMVCGLIVATVIDFELYIIPDGCTVPAMVFAVLFSFAVGQTYLVPLWFQDPSAAKAVRYVLPDALQPLVFTWDASAFAAASPHWHGLLVSLAGLVTGAVVTWSIRAVGFLVLKMEALGDGDVVLMALIGATLGWQPVLVVFFLAPLPAVPVAVALWVLRRHRGGPHYFPYGPWLSISAVVLLLGWQFIWPWVTPVFDMGLLLIAVGGVMLITMAALLQLIQTGKRLLGLAPLLPSTGEDWTSADHLSYYGSERPDEQTGQWPRPQWPGGRSGRGLLQQHVWRQPPGQDGGRFL